MIIHQQILFKKSPLDIPLLLFMVIQTISTFFSIHPRTSFFGFYTRFHGGLLSTIAYSLIYWTLVNNLNLKQLKALLFTTVISAIGVGLYALPERMLGISPSCIILKGKFNTDCWVQNVQTRVFATLGQPNWLAALLSMLLPVQIYFFLHPPEISRLLKLPAKIKIVDDMMARRLFWIAGIVICMTALLFTQSRSGLLGLGAAMLFFTLGRFLLIKKQRIKANALLLSLLLGLTLLTFIVGTGFTPSLNQLLNNNSFRLSQQADQTSSIESTIDQQEDLSDQGILISPSQDIRYVVWQGALNVWRRYPWLGSGPETFGYSYYLDRPKEQNLLSEWDFLYNKAHNEFLNFLANTGLVGLGSYIILMGTSFLIIFKKTDPSRSNKSNQDLLLALGGSLISFNATNFWGFSTVSVTIVWILIMSYLGKYHQKYQQGFSQINVSKKFSSLLPEDDNKNRKLGFLSYATLLCLLLIMAHLLLSLFTIWQADYHFALGEAYSKANSPGKAVEYLQRAILLSPKEAIFYDELADSYASMAVEFYEAGDLEASKQFSQLAIETSDKTIELNPHHFNFFQTRATIFSKLAQIDDQYLEEAKEAFVATSMLSPTHPKPIYHQAIIEWIQGDSDQSIVTIKKAIELKPNYHNARYQLGQIYESRGECDLAREQYQYILDNLIPNDPNLLKKIEELEC